LINKFLDFLPGRAISFNGDLGPGNKSSKKEKAQK